LSEVGRKVSDFPTDFLYLNSWSIEPNPNEAEIKNSQVFSEKQIANISVFYNMSDAF
jgi:hypothetical protein